MGKVRSLSVESSGNGATNWTRSKVFCTEASAVASPEGVIMREEITVPSRAIVTRAGLPLSTLYAHGVLVVRCNDAHVQCLQSTRDPTDVLCTTAPRHR